VEKRSLWQTEHTGRVMTMGVVKKCKVLKQPP